jgi:hypothetical protein
MNDKQLVDSLTGALKAEGFIGIEKRRSSSSLTISAHKGQRRAVVHIADPGPPPGPRLIVNPDVPDASVIATLARAPRVAAAGASGQPVPSRRSAV